MAGGAITEKRRSVSLSLPFTADRLLKETAEAAAMAPRYTTARAPLERAGSEVTVLAKE
jgi:hypothetical protein